MAFKSMKEYTEERVGEFFLLRNDGDFADVVFLYREYSDVMAASVHYIKSADYTGYVHCTGRGCPACARNIRVQNKLFIPMFVFSINGESVNRIAFWDRNTRFNQNLMDSVFTNYPNPVAYTFRITRHGASGDVNTNYEIVIQGINTSTYDEILSFANMTLPEGYDHVCKDMTAVDMNKLFVNPSASSAASDDMSTYSVTPRVAVPVSSTVAPTVVVSPPTIVSGDAAEAATEDDLADPVF